MPGRARTLANVRINRVLPETELPAGHFCRWHCGRVFFIRFQ